MIIINGKYFRNLQEQVLYLTELIEAIKPYIAGNGITIAEQTIAVDPDTVQLKLTAGNGIKIDGTIISADLSSESITKIDITTAGVVYNSTTGAKLIGNAIVHYEDESIDNASMTFELPIEPGDGVTIDANEANDGLVISASGGSAVEVTLPSGGTSGTLTEEQSAKLLSDDNNWVSINNERYILMDKEHVTGMRTYTHDGFTDQGMVKYFNLTVSTRAFTITDEYLNPHIILVGTSGTIAEDYRDIVKGSNCIIELQPTSGPIKYFRQIGDDTTNYIYACQYNQTLTRLLITKATYAWSTVDLVFENAVNKVTSLSASNTNAQYPSAKVTYDEIQKVTGIANSATAKANDASEVATSARSTANSAKTAAEQADTKAGEAKTQAASALETADQASAAANLAKSTADTASTTATNAKTTADEAKALAQTNETTISEVQETIPTFQLSGTTLTINMPN